MNAKIYNPIPLIVSQAASDSSRFHMAKLGVPFPKGAVGSLERKTVVSSAGERLPTAVQTTAHWPDGSVKWGLVTFIAARTPAERSGYLLVDSEDVADSDVHSPVVLERSDEGIVVRENDTCYEFIASDRQIFPNVNSAGKPVWAASDIDISLRDRDGLPVFIEKTSTEVLRQDAISALIEVAGIARPAKHLEVKLAFRFEMVAGALLSVTVEIHNPQRAIHSEGIWDLGDPNSFFFKEFTLQVRRSGSDRITLIPESGADFYSFTGHDTAKLFQASSGGENWNSPTHVNSEGISCNQFCGYSLDIKDKDQAASGKRACPVVRFVRDGQGAFVVAIRDFWQNFPKSLVVSETCLAIGIFPAEHNDGHELQGGERKQHEIAFSFTDDLNSLNWMDASSTIKVEPAVLEKADVLGNPVGSIYAPYDDLLSDSLCEKNGLLAKREDQDEYGWRHYGDVVADHETLYHDGDNIFVSHYNNQYDPVYGFARQYLLTSDPRWYRLMDNLARHVLDIDIYRTIEDRAEYNHGLFWHTDHYLQAFTCSHRTYSKSHYASDWDCNKGGGPGPEHCYTTGLKLFYHLSGNEDAREAVLGLTNWIRFYYEGTGTVVERCKELLTSDRNNLLSVLKGHQVFRYRYPFNRGVGNYIRALIDSYELTLDQQYIAEAEAVIMNTFGASDDIDSRNLDDVEHTWFYTVFLQEVVRYLDVKRAMGSLDDAFCYARDALLYYARWMALNETPALESTKPLEYPNDTWIAQDIRKANILYAAYRYETNERELLRERAQEFRDYVTDSLSTSDTRHFSRIQIILMQNHGASSLMDQVARPYDEVSGLTSHSSLDKPCFYTRFSFIAYLVKSFWQVVRKFSLKREIAWVRARLG